VTGSFGLVLEDQSSTGYPILYTIPSANTWTYITATIPGALTGTWPANNTFSLAVRFGFGVGSNWNGTPGTWSNSRILGATGATSFVATNGATWNMTGLQLEVGNTATAFDYTQSDQELRRCQRYYWQTGDSTAQCYQIGQGFIRYTSGAAAVTIQVPYPVTMRAKPTFSISGGLTGKFTCQVADISATSTQHNGLWSAAGPNMGWIDLQIASNPGWSVGQAVSVYENTNNQLDHMQFSAEA
jgi:hypothetical protein